MTNAHSQTESNSSCSASATRCVLGALAAVAALPMAASPAHADDAPSRVNVLFNMEFSDKYLTPRGMIVQNEGLVYQPLLLAFASFYKGDNFSVTGVGGVWNCFGTCTIPDDSGNGTYWYEIDPIAGLSFGLGKLFTLDVTYTAFNMQILNIGTSQHLETKLSFNDTPYLKKFALHPSIIFWKELDNKAVANTDANPEESYYFDIGVAPSYTFEKCGMKLELPCRMLLADEDFYGTGAGSASTVGLWEVGIKASMPLKFMPEGYGHWSFHAGFKYVNFVDDNLQAVANGGGFGPNTDDTVQFYCGISTFF